MDKKSICYKWLMFLAMFYVMVLITTQLLVHKIFIYHYIHFTVAVLVFPLSFTISDIVCEVYGYEASKQLLWTGLIITLIFCIIIITLVHLPIPCDVPHQQVYKTIFDPMLRSYAAAFIATMVGGFINIYFISKTKILLLGRYFWLRSIGATIIGQLSFSIIADPLTFYGVVPTHEIATIALTCYIVKFIYACVFAAPATWCVNYLKLCHKDNIALGKTYNPFSAETD